MFFCCFAWIHGLIKGNQNRPFSLIVFLKTNLVWLVDQTAETDLLTLPPCLFQVYECLQRFLRDSPTLVLNNATGVLFQVMFPLIHAGRLVDWFSVIFISASALWWLQLLIDVRASEGCSEDAKELCHLLRQPHLQVRRVIAFQRFHKKSQKNAK